MNSPLNQVIAEWTPRPLLWLCLFSITGCEMFHEANFKNQRTTAKFARTSKQAETLRRLRQASVAARLGSRKTVAAGSGTLAALEARSGKQSVESTKSPGKIIQTAYDETVSAGDAQPIKVPPAPASHDQELPNRAELKVQTLARTYPIDLPTALRLGDAENLQIGLARERIAAAEARVAGAEALWLPSLTAGTTYQFHVGQIQRAPGQIIEQNRNSLAVNGGPNLSVNIADAIYEPLVQQQRLQAESAAAAFATNDILLRISSAYFDLLSANAVLAIAQETRANAQDLARVTNEFANQGVGLRSDAERATTELGQRDQQVILAQERVTVTSATLAQLLRLDPQTQLVPLERKVVPIELVAENQRLADLVVQALSSRPELAEQQHLVQAACERLNRATYAPLIPSIVLGYQAGGFGGGPGAYFGDFSDREDLTAAAIWELKNLGFGNRAERNLRQSELNQSQLRALRLADIVASEVVSAHQIVVARKKQVEVAQTTVTAAVRSHDLNRTRIRGGSGLPIEVLQAIQALERSRNDYLQAVISYNKAQFTLLTAIGTTPVSPEARPE